jgi:hypothetical protein
MSPQDNLSLFRYSPYGIGQPNDDGLAALQLPAEHDPHHGGQRCQPVLGPELRLPLTQAPNHCLAIGYIWFG